MGKFLNRLAFIASASVAFAGLCGSTPPDGEEKVLTWQDNYVSIEGGNFEITEGGYSEKGNTLRLKPTSSTMDVYLNVASFQEYEVTEKVHISFRIKSSESTNKYDTYKLRTWGDTVIDYAFENNKWNWVNFDGVILEKGELNTVLLRFTDLEGYESIDISEFTVDDEIFDTENLFGGVEVIQFEGSSRERACGYVFVSGDEIVVFDGGGQGDGAELANIIFQYGRRVSGWFISHFHHDHCTALREILANYDIEIDTLYYDIPTVKQMPKEEKYITTLNNAVNSQYLKKIKNIEKPKAKDVFYFNDMAVKVLNTMDPLSNANNTSIVYKVETPGESVLLWGDTNSNGDKYIKDSYFLLEMRSCRVVVMAHHGQGGVSKKVYDTIDDIKICLYPAPRWLYDNDEGEGIGTAIYASLETRSWMRERGVRASFSAADGRIHFQ